MLTTILIVIAALIVILLVVAAMKPDTFRVQRAATIKAPPSKIFPLINDFHNWPAWSPWEKIDPDMTRTHSGPQTGKGAVYAWEGNKKVGSGRMEITESAPSSRLSLKLDFLKPFEAHNITDFTLEPSGDSTNVTWAMHGPNQFMTKVMTIFKSMDQMVGKDFEAGLANMKSIAEK